MGRYKKFVAGLIAGTVMGALAVLLLTPKSGKENRHIVANRAAELWHRFQGWRAVESPAESSGRQVELSG
ncbi:MAG: YtxH domain-containing protein [Dehalococcoidia bacterium]